MPVLNVFVALNLLPNRYFPKISLINLPRNRIQSLLRTFKCVHNIVMPLPSVLWRSWTYSIIKGKVHQTHRAHTGLRSSSSWSLGPPVCISLSKSLWANFLRTFRGKPGRRRVHGGGQNLQNLGLGLTMRAYHITAAVAVAAHAQLLSYFAWLGFLKNTLWGDCNHVL